MPPDPPGRDKQFFRHCKFLLQILNEEHRNSGSHESNSNSLFFFHVFFKHIIFHLFSFDSSQKMAYLFTCPSKYKPSQKGLRVNIGPGLKIVQNLYALLSWSINCGGVYKTNER